MSLYADQMLTELIHKINSQTEFSDTIVSTWVSGFIIAHHSAAVFPSTNGVSTCLHGQCRILLCGSAHIELIPR